MVQSPLTLRRSQGIPLNLIPGQSEHYQHMGNIRWKLPSKEEKPLNSRDLQALIPSNTKTAVTLHTLWLLGRGQESTCLPDSNTGDQAVLSLMPLSLGTLFLFPSPLSHSSGLYLSSATTYFNTIIAPFEPAPQHGIRAKCPHWKQIVNGKSLPCVFLVCVSGNEKRKNHFVPSCLRFLKLLKCTGL